MYLENDAFAIAKSLQISQRHVYRWHIGGIGA